MTSRSATRLGAVHLLRARGAVSVATAIDLPGIMSSQGMTRAGYAELMLDLVSLKMVRESGARVYLSREGQRATKL